MAHTFGGFSPWLLSCIAFGASGEAHITVGAHRRVKSSHLIAEHQKGVHRGWGLTVPSAGIKELPIGPALRGPTTSKQHWTRTEPSACGLLGDIQDPDHRGTQQCCPGPVIKWHHQDVLNFFAAHPTTCLSSTFVGLEDLEFSSLQPTSSRALHVYMRLS